MKKLFFLIALVLSVICYKSLPHSTNYFDAEKVEIVVSDNFPVAKTANVQEVTFVNIDNHSNSEYTLELPASANILNRLCIRIM